MVTSTGKSVNAGMATDTRFILTVLSGMMLYLSLATAGFALLGALGILPDMTAHVSWLVGVAVSSGIVFFLSLALSRRKNKRP